MERLTQSLNDVVAEFVRIPGVPEFLEGKTAAFKIAHIGGMAERCPLSAESFASLQIRITQPECLWTKSSNTVLQCDNSVQWTEVNLLKVRCL